MTIREKIWFYGSITFGLFVYVIGWGMFESGIELKYAIPMIIIGVIITLSHQIFPNFPKIKY